MAIDINLKSVGKKLSKEKYTVNNQYFVVVDHDSHTKKMRVGMKLYSMRGSAMIGNFVDILSRHLDIEVLDEL